MESYPAQTLEKQSFSVCLLMCLIFSPLVEMEKRTLFTRLPCRAIIVTLDFAKSKRLSEVVANSQEILIYPSAPLPQGAWHLEKQL